jgi:hypothetical protein
MEGGAIIDSTGKKKKKKEEKKGIDKPSLVNFLILRTPPKFTSPSIF